MMSGSKTFQTWCENKCKLKLTASIQIYDIAGSN